MAPKYGSSLARSSALVATGTAAGQAVLLVSSIAVARLFTPAQIGVFVAMSAVATVSALFFTGRYELAIPLPDRHEDAVALGYLGLGLAVTSTLLVGVALVTIPAPWWPAAVGNPDLVAWSVPLLSLGIAVLQIANQTAVRARLYSALATRALAFPVIAGTLQVCAGLVGFGVSGLVIALFIGQIAAALVTWLPSVRSMPLEPSTPARLRIRNVALSYRTFPVFLAPAGALNALATQLPILLMTVFFGTAIGGQFGMATKLLAAPVALVGQTIGYVYSGEIAHRARTGAHQIASLFFKTSASLAAVGGLMVFALFLVGEPIFVALLGDRWRTAGSFAVALSIGVCAQLITTPVSQTLIVAGRQKTQFFLDLLRVSLVSIAAVITHQTERSAIETAWWLSLTVALGYLLMWIANMRAAKQTRSSPRTAHGQASGPRG